MLEMAVLRFEHGISEKTSKCYTFVWDMVPKSDLEKYLAWV